MYACRRYAVLFVRYLRRYYRNVFVFVRVITIRLCNGLTAFLVVCARVPTATCARVVPFKSSVSRTLIKNGFAGDVYHSINEIVISSSRIRFRVYFLVWCQSCNVSGHASAITCQSGSEDFVFGVANARFSFFRFKDRVTACLFRVFYTNLFRLCL